MTADLKTRMKEFVQSSVKNPDKMKRIFEASAAQNRIEHKEFKRKYKDGICYICKSSFADFRQERPCLHWLMRLSKDIKKDHIEKILMQSGLFSTQAFLRWLANEEVFLTNINDLKEDVANTELFNCTIKYKNIEWTIWCTETDYDGHAGTQHDFSHWHFQMKLDDRPFIKFKDFHIKMTNEDILKFITLRESGEKIKHRFVGGESTQDVFDNFTAEQMLLNMKNGHGNENKAPFNISTIVMAKEGQRIPGAIIDDAFNESKRTGETVSAVMSRMLSEKADVKVLVSPSDNIPDFSERSGRNKKRG